MAREGRTNEALLERIEAEKRVTVLATVAAITDLPEEAYMGLANTAGFKALQVILANPTAPNDAKRIATKRMLEDVRDRRFKKLSYEQGMSLKSALATHTDVCAEVFAGREYLAFTPGFDTYDSAAFAQVVISGLGTEGSLKGATYILDNIRKFVGEQDGQARSAITDEVRSQRAYIRGFHDYCLSAVLDDAQAAQLEQSILDALKTLGESGRTASQNNGYYRYYSTYDETVDGIVAALDEIRGDLVEVSVNLQTLAGQELEDEMVDIFTRSDTRAAERVGNLVLRNQALTFEALLTVCVRSGVQASGTRLWRTSGQHLQDLVEPQRVFKTFLEHLPNGERTEAGVDLLKASHANKTAAFDARSLARSIYNDCARQGLDAVVALVDLLDGVDVDGLAELMVTNLSAERVRFADAGDTVHAERVNELALRFVDTISVRHLTNQYSDMNGLLWGLVFEAIPADNDIAWTQFMAMLETEGPIGNVLRSVRRLCKATTPATPTEVVPAVELQEDGESGQFSMVV
jgi:hypothetical protein